MRKTTANKILSNKLMRIKCLRHRPIVTWVRKRAARPVHTTRKRTLLARLIDRLSCLANIENRSGVIWKIWEFLIYVRSIRSSTTTLQCIQPIANEVCKRLNAISVAHMTQLECE